MEMRIGRSENETDLFSRQWTLGSCYGPRPRFTYLPNETHFDRCCLPEGKYTLICINKQSKYGWGNVTFEIDGKRYCDDFVGFKAMRTVSLKGDKWIL